MGVLYPTAPPGFSSWLVYLMCIQKEPHDHSNPQKLFVHEARY